MALLGGAAVIHLEGMGLIGSLIAWQLSARGRSFTWSDNDQPVNAWSACTGACYPASTPGSVDLESYEKWREWLRPGVIYPRDCFEICDYWVDGQNKSLPHGLKAEVVATHRRLRKVAVPSIHVNAQELVARTRTMFAEYRMPCTSRVPDGVIKIVAHGFGTRLQRYLWGWTAVVDLGFDKDVFGNHPCFYLRKNRFQFAYAYPRPGTRQWYAGSSLITQGTPKKLEIEPKFEAWQQRLAELTDGAVRVTLVHYLRQGWRPAVFGSLSKTEGHAANRRRSWLLVRPEQRLIQVPSMASNGFRNFPELWRQLDRVLP